MHWPGHKFALGLFIAVVVAWVSVMAILMRKSALPSDATGTMLAVFDPSTSEDKAFAAIAAAGGRPVRQTSFGFIWIVSSDEPGLAGKLKAQGALGSYRELPISPTIAGCFALADAKISSAFE
jgi:hypothetical protein